MQRGTKRARLQAAKQSFKKASRKKSKPDAGELALQTLRRNEIQQMRYFDTWFYHEITNNGLYYVPVARAGVNPGVVPRALNGLVIGAAEGQRDGDRVTVKKITVSGAVIEDRSQGENQFDIERQYSVYLILDKQHNAANGIQPNDIFINPSEAAFAGNNCQNILNMPLRNLNNSKRFRVLHRVNLGGRFAPAIAAGAFPQHGRVGRQLPFEFNWKGTLEVQYASNAGDDTGILTNALYIVVIPSSSRLFDTTNGNGAPDYTCVFQANARIRYLP